jgi:hypothetical protein
MSKYVQLEFYNYTGIECFFHGLKCLSNEVGEISNNYWRATNDKLDSPIYIKESSLPKGRNFHKIGQIPYDNINYVFLDFQIHLFWHIDVF